MFHLRVSLILCVIYISASSRILTDQLGTTAFYFPAYTSSTSMYESPPETAYDQYVNRKTMRFTDAVYKQGIHTVQLYKDNLSFSYPMIKLGSPDKLILQFDELGNVVNNYSYKVIHCNANWTPSELTPFDYLDGFDFGQIYDYDFSFNTRQDFVHHQLFFPNTDFRITRSGNYLLMVYSSDDPDQIALTRRFLVFDDKVDIQGEIVRTNVVKYRREKQVVQFKVNLQGLVVQNPFDDIKITISQNLRWDNMITGIQPRFIRQNFLIYDSHLSNAFYGGKEFRYFDARSIRFSNDRIRFIEDLDRTHLFLYGDEIRSYKSYFYNRDINGRYFIDIREGRDEALESDYVHVHFKLPFDQLPTDGNIYVIGAFSDWELKQENIMRYDYNYKAYFTTLFLKQGYYNYSYVFVKDGENKFDEGLIEGNSFETENDYLIMVYYKNIGERHDELMGVKHINSLWGEMRE